MEVIISVIFFSIVGLLIAGLRERSAGKVKSSRTSAVSTSISPQNSLRAILSWAQSSEYIVGDIDEKKFNLILEDRPSALSGPGYLYPISIYSDGQTGSIVHVGITAKVGIDITPRIRLRHEKCINYVKGALISYIPLHSDSQLRDDMGINAHERKVSKEAVDALIQDGITALKASNNDRAFNLLSSALKLDSTNELAWLWLSGAVSTDNERLYCLRKIIELNPNNADAKRGLNSLPHDIIPISPLG
jgi:hypothetical protein